jgi:tetratricopeptide (TPR) repeat protein/DNA-binding Xre family transcriptional regulator
MPRSVKLHPEHKETARLTLERKGFLTQGKLAGHLGIALSTVSNFFNCIAISVAKFEEICDALDLDPQVMIQPHDSVQETSKTSFAPCPFVLSNYDEATWVGRDTLITDLLNKLQKQTHVLCLTGISGIGKTALGECLASQAWKNNPSFQWIYLEILEGQSTDFASVAAALLAKLGDRELDPQERNNPEQVAKRLLQKLKSHFYWIQLDSLERLLNPEQPTEFSDPYWITFLQRCLTESNFVSRLVLTSQAFPQSLVEFDDRYPNTWAEIQLAGLSQDQQLEFFAKRGVVVEPTNREILAYIAKTYEGHPLVLRVIAEDILQEFAGDILCYWQVNQREFEQVARELQDVRLHETEYNEALDHKVRERIRKSIEQLPADAFDLLCRSSVFRRPVPKKFWLAMISDRPPQQQKAAYHALSDRALIEREGIHKGQFLIRQHNLIRDVAYALLKADTAIWEIAERQAARLWRTYEPPINASNLELIVGYLEAFDHYWELKDLENVRSIICIRLEGFTKENLHSQLGRWGYYSEQIKIYSKLLDIYPKSGAYQNRAGEASIWGNLGNAYCSLSKYDQAIKCHKKDLEIVQEINDLNGESTALGNLGADYQILGLYSQAISYYRQQLKIAREEIEDPYEEGRALNNLGTVYYELRDYNKAIEYYDERLKIAEKIDCLEGKASALGNLGNAWCALGDYAKAIEYHKQSLSINREIEYKLGEGQDLVNLGVAQTKSRLYKEALESLRDGFKIFETIGNRDGEAETLIYLAELYQTQGEMDIARQYCQQGLELAIELGIPLKEECEVLLQTLGESNAS